MSGQSIMDRVVAAKHSIAGQGLAKSVCKATTEEVMGPKKKHLDYLLQCTNEPNVSIPQLADLLIERTQHQSWVVVFKSLITIHNLMNYGNERFTQYLASNNCTFNLGSFMDKGGVQGYDMSTFIRRYSKYLNEKATSYRSMAFDFCKVKRGKDDGLLRTMNADKLLKSLPALQRQVDALIEFDCTPNELTNGVINACFLLMFKDLIRLFACYNDGIINLLEKYFDMNKKQCKDALEIYKRFLVRMDKVSEFLKVAENVGIDKGDIPDLAKGLKENTTMKSAPSSLLDALEQHLQALEGKKGAGTPTTTVPAGFTSAINSISSNSTIQISDEEKKRILDDENNRLRMLKDQQGDTPIPTTTQEQRLKEVGSPQQTTPQQTSTNPFMTSPVSSGSNLLGSPTTNEPVKASDDLLSLTGNPFVENVQQVMAMNAAISTMNTTAFSTPAWNTTTTNNVTATSSGFTSDADFDKAFQNSSKSSTDTLTVDVSGHLSVMQPSPSSTSPSAAPPAFTEEPLDPLSSLMGGDSTTAFGGGLDSDLLSGVTSTPFGGGMESNIMGEAISSSAFSSGIDSTIVGGNPITTPFGIGMDSNIMGGATGPTSFGSGMESNVMDQATFTSGMDSNIMSGATAAPSFGISMDSNIMGGTPSTTAFGSGLDGGIMSGSPGVSTDTGGFSDLNLPPNPAVHPRSLTPTFMDSAYGGMSPGRISPAAGRVSPALSTGSDQGTGFDAFGEVLQPSNTSKQEETKAQQKLIQGDLNMSLAQLAGNLNINGPASQVKKTQHEWQPKGEQKKTGGTNWQQQAAVSSSTISPGFAQPMMASPNMYPQQPMMQPGMMAQPRPVGVSVGMGMQPGMVVQPGMGGMQQPVMYGGMQQQPAFGGMQPMGGGMQQPRPPTSTNDPFGAL